MNQPILKYSNEIRSSVEMNDTVSRPEIAFKVDDMAQYDTVIIGFPIWWYTSPTIIKTFLESYDFSGKKIAVFATSGGSGIENSISDLQSAYPELNIATGKRYSDATEDDVKEWIESLK